MPHSPFLIGLFVCWNGNHKTNKYSILVLLTLMIIEYVTIKSYRSVFTLGVTAAAAAVLSIATVIYHNSGQLIILQSFSQVLEVLFIQTTTSLLFKVVAKSLAELTPWDMIRYNKQLSVLRRKNLKLTKQFPAAHRLSKVVVPKHSCLS